MSIDEAIEQAQPANCAPRSRRYGDLITDDFRVHRSVFTDPRIFADEMDRIFGGTWVYLLHESEILSPNDFETRAVGRRPVIVTRDEAGTIAALFNRCTHRGTLLCPIESGSAARFQCAYHGWTFSNTGKLVGITYPDGYRESFDVAGHDLGRLPRVESYRGFVFGSLNPDVEPVADWLGPARPTFDWLVDRFPDIRMLKASTLEYHGNWKLQNDNNGDMYHVPFTHKSTVTMSENRGYRRAFGHFQERPGTAGGAQFRQRPQDDRPAAGYSVDVGGRQARPWARSLRGRPAREDRRERTRALPRAGRTVGRKPGHLPEPPVPRGRLLVCVRAGRPSTARECTPMCPSWSTVLAK